MFDKLKLKAEWKQRGHTGNEIADLIGMTPQNLSNIIRKDNRDFTVTQAAMICSHIGSTLDSFVKKG